DFDHDGIDDLAITETYGNIWIFRNTVVGGTSTPSPGVNVKQGPRLDALDIIEWNGDTKPDLLTSLSVDNPGSIFINQSTGAGNFTFANAIQPLAPCSARPPAASCRSPSPTPPPRRTSTAPAGPCSHPRATTTRLARSTSLPGPSFTRVTSKPATARSNSSDSSAIRADRCS